MDLSEYENMPRANPVYSDSCLYETINNVLESAGNAYLLFCPFCVKHFEFKFSLMEHLRKTHHRFLLEATDKTLEFQKCPFCHAKFFGKHLAARHSLQNHSKVIAEIYCGNQNKIFEGKSCYSSCLFCPKIFKKLEYCKLTSHIEEDHLLEFDDIFQDGFLGVSSNSKDSLSFQSSFEHVDLNENCKNTMTILSKENIGQPPMFSEEKDFPNSSNVNCYDFTEFQTQLNNIKAKVCKVKEHPPVKSILKSNGNNEKKCNEKFGSNKSVRRVLRFDLPNSSDENKENSLDSLECESLIFPETKHLCTGVKELVEFYQQESLLFPSLPVHCSTPKSSFSLNDFKVEACKQNEMKKTYPKICSGFKSYVNNVDSYNFPYKCGKCHQLFNDNDGLLHHVKRSHKKLSGYMLQPFYQCAVCNVKFFKNSYLKKHNKLHSSQSLQKVNFS